MHYATILPYIPTPCPTLSTKFLHLGATSPHTPTTQRCTVGTHRNFSTNPCHSVYTPATPPAPRYTTYTLPFPSRTITLLTALLRSPSLADIPSYPQSSPSFAPAPTLPRIHLTTAPKPFSITLQPAAIIPQPPINTSHPPCAINLSHLSTPQLNFHYRSSFLPLHPASRSLTSPLRVFATDVTSGSYSPLYSNPPQLPCRAH